MQGARLKRKRPGIRRPGKRGVAWAIKYCDAAGRQVWETLGREPEWSEVRAQRELGKRLLAVERDRWRKPERTTFATLAARYETDYLPGRNLKPSTVSDYGSIIRGHLVPYFGHLALAALEPADVDGYVAAQPPLASRRRRSATIWPSSA